ncbi:MAG: hypothetical protein AAFU67_07860, partial [Bacteroidota bacterium]
LTIMGTEKANALSLSKGGWEGWLQCELWGTVTVDYQITTEREVSYPDENTRCDLVCTPGPPNSQLWIEIKAYGIFRQGDENHFLDGIARDVYKLMHMRPPFTEGLSLVVIPNGIATQFEQAINQRGWLGFSRNRYEYVTLYHMNI